MWHNVALEKFLLGSKQLNRLHMSNGTCVCSV
jgi:hypothetical protein